MLRSTLRLLSPLWLSGRNLVLRHRRAALVLVVSAAGLLLLLERGTEWFLGHIMEVGIGHFLSHHLMSMFLFSLQFLLAFSAVINALSAFFLSQELEAWETSPVDPWAIFWAKLVETCVTSAWMVVLLLVPVLFAYGNVLAAPPLYYLAAAILPVPYVVMVAAVGVVVALGIARLLPVRRTRELMRFFGVLGIALLVVLFRLLQPERLVEQGGFDKLAGYLASLQPEGMKRFPSYWLTEVLFSLIRSDWGPFFREDLLRFLGVAALAVGAAALAFRLLYRQAMDKFRAAPPPPPRRPGVLIDLMLAPARALPPALSTLMVKDTKVLARSPVVWTQLSLMAVIVLIYGYNLYLLPVETLEHLQPGLRGMIAFSNLGFMGFLLVAAALRFGFPSISLEGEGFLVVHTSPLGMDRYFAAKFLQNLVPMAGLGLVLAGLAHGLLRPATPLLVVGYLQAVLFSTTVTAMALDFGASFRNLQATNFAHLPSGPGGIGFLVAAMGYVILVLALQAYPFWLYRQATLWRLPVGPGAWALGALLLGASLALQLGVLGLCRRRAVQSLEGGLE